MPPAHLFIVRHGERMDHVDKEFGKTYPRPHDSPLTPNGIGMAEMLGVYLVEHYRLDPANTVVLTSPLTRCVQTAHGLLTAAQYAAGGEGATASIHLEPAIMEGAYWLFQDMKQNPAVVNPENGVFTCPEPVYYDAEHHRAETSPLVALDSPVQLYPAPVFTIVDGALHDASFPERCHAAARALLTAPALADKTVILVGHGETVLRLQHTLVEKELPKSFFGPKYTSFVHFAQEGSGEAKRLVPESLDFRTPHLPEPPQES